MLTDLTHRQAGFISGTFDLVHQEVQTAQPFFHRQLIGYMLTRRLADLRSSRLYHQMLDHLGYRSASGGAGPRGRLAARLDQRRGAYKTVNWPAVVDRARPWLRQQLAQHRGDPVGEIGYRSLDTTDALPLALFALPILTTDVA
jgi:hypothetical protein